MIPRSSLFGGLTRRGRLRNGWAKAAAEPDPARCAERLRVLWPAFAAKPAAYVDMWPAFLDFVLRGHAAPALTPADLTALEDIGFGLTRLEPGLSQWDALRPLLAAWDVRRQPRAACALLTRMYHALDAGQQERIAIARALAGRGARGDEQLVIYVERLREAGSAWAEPPMRALLADYLTIGFGSDPIRVKRAAELARTLTEAQLPIPGVDLALGFACLLVERRYGDAARYLENARAADPADHNALLGLVSAWTHNGDHDLVVAVARGAGGPLAPVLAGMGELSGMLSWLDEPTAPGPPPCTPAALAELNVRQLAGDWLDFAIGRAHLLAGNAGHAADLLAPLAERHPEYPQWTYHAAWALSLCGDRDGVTRHFLAARDWSTAWTVGCLLLDADPEATDRVAEELDRQPPPAEHTEVVSARLAMARRQRPAALPWQLVDAPLPEMLESLRTMLGQRFTGHAPATPLDETTRAVLAHLPLADQLLWDGLAALSTDRGRGRVLLERAAHRLGYSRAALVLAVHHLEEARYGEAEHLLARFNFRNDPDFQVLRTWVRARTDEDATADLERLAEQGNGRAHYALGSVYIGRMAGSAERRQVFAHQAAAEFRAALRDPERPVPFDAAALARCAELYDTGAPAAIDGAGWSEVEALPAPRRTAWLRWLIALAELTSEPTVGRLDAGDYLVTTMDDADDGSADVWRSVAQALTSASLADADPARASAFTDLVGRLTRRRPDPELARLYDLITAATARAGGPAGPLNGSPQGRLVKAELALRDNDQETAVRELRALTDLGPVAQLGPVLADLVAGKAPDPEIVLDIPSGLPRRTEVAIRVADAARLAEVDVNRSITLLAPVIGDIVPAELVNLRRGLPLLCAGVGLRRQPPGPLPDLILGMAADRDDDVDLAMLARCATAVGDQQLAGMLWRDAVAAQAEVTEEARAEYTRFLCHQAVLASRQGDVLGAAHQLLLAARVGSGRRLDQPMYAADEVAAFNEVFRTAVEELVGRAARNRAKGEWRAMIRSLTTARDADDERQAVLMFAQLEDLLALVERGEV